MIDAKKLLAMLSILGSSVFFAACTPATQVEPEPEAAAAEVGGEAMEKEDGEAMEADDAMEKEDGEAMEADDAMEKEAE